MRYLDRNFDVENRAVRGAHQLTGSSCPGALGLLGALALRRLLGLEPGQLGLKKSDSLLIVVGHLEALSHHLVEPRRETVPVKPSLERFKLVSQFRDLLRMSGLDLGRRWNSLFHRRNSWTKSRSTFGRQISKDADQLAGGVKNVTCGIGRKPGASEPW
jgi:hypothetical protein